MGSAEDAAREVLEGLRTEVIEHRSITSLDWTAMYERYASLSSGEKTLLDVARALWNGVEGEQSSVARVMQLDSANFSRVLRGMAIARG